VPAQRRVRFGGPFPYDRDGTVFQNREGRLPSQPRGYYREYTVETPGSPDRGARRIVSGGDPPAEFFYTDDHYRSFRRLEAANR
jgi:ribonuclease T1